jgi:ribosomal protein L15E
MRRFYFRFMCAKVTGMEKQTSAARVAELRAKRKADGLVRTDFYVHPDDVPTIKALIARLSKRRAKGARPAG